MALAERRTTAEKVVWIIFWFLTWSLASTIHGLFFATRPLAVTTRIAFALLVVLAITTAVVMIAVPMTRTLIPRPM